MTKVAAGIADSPKHPGPMKPGHAPAKVDHKSAVDKMHPEHVHKLVQDAHAGKFGPEAQQTAQQAMQPAQPDQQADPDGDDQQAPQRNMGDIFGGSQPAQQAPAAPAPRGASVFAGRGGF